MAKQDLNEKYKKKKGLLDYFFLFLAFLSGLVSGQGVPVRNNSEPFREQPPTPALIEHGMVYSGEKPPDGIYYGAQPEIALPFELSFEIGSVKISINKITPETLFLSSAYFLVQFIKTAKITLGDIKDKGQINSAIKELDSIISGLDQCLSDPLVQTLGKQSGSTDRIDQIVGRSKFILCIDTHFEIASEWLQKYRIDIPEEYAKQWDEDLSNIKKIKTLPIADMEPEGLKRLFNARLGDLKRYHRTI